MRIWKTRCLRTVNWGAVLLVCLALAAAANAEQETSEAASHARAETPAIAIAAAHADASLDPIADGIAHRLSRELEEAGAQPGLSDLIRRNRRKAPSQGEGTRQILQRALAAGASACVLLDLEDAEGAIQITLRVYSAQSAEPAELLAAATRSARPDQLGANASDALRSLFPRLGLPVPAVRNTSILQVDQLAARGRALRAMDRGELSRAWFELAGQRSEDANSLRTAILAAADSNQTSVAERARLLAARGQPDPAWVLLYEQERERLESANPPARLLLAAADVQFARGRSTDAHRFYERAIAADPKLADAHLGLAQVEAVRTRTDAARVSFERAAALDPESPRPLELMAKIESRDPQRRAHALLEAGTRHARGLGSEAASQHFAAAIRLDPQVEARARDESSRLWLRLGDAKGAAQEQTRAIELGGESAARLITLARARRQQGDAEAARESLERATELEPEDANAHRELALAYEQAGRPQDAIQSLRQAVALAPTDSKARSQLAQVLCDTGSEQEALDILQAEGPGTPRGAEDLRLRAEILSGRGDTDGAARALAQAIDLRPADPRLRVELAEVQSQTGLEREAGVQRELAIALGGYEPELQPERDPHEQENLTSTTALVPLVASFQQRDREGPKRVAFLGAREFLDERGQLLDWLRPTTPDMAGIEAEISAAIRTQYELVPQARVESFAAAAVADVTNFQSDASLDSDSIAAVNLSLSTDAVFVAQLVRAPGGPASHRSPCGEAPFFEIELRRLSGYSADDVRALANLACLPGGLEARGSWNLKAAGVYGALLLLLLVIFRRGWGSVVVGLKLPPNTKALFSVSISKRPRRVKSHGTGKLPSGRASGRIERSLRSLDLRERRLREGKPTIIRWIPARKRPYYLTVRGPLLDYLSDELVGDFLEEQTVTIKRGERTRVEFDMRPKECALQVSVNEDGRALEQACVAVRGDRSSLRYCSNGSAFLYLEAGTHLIVAGSGGCVAEREVVIEDLEAKVLPIDFSAEHGLVFSQCPDAVLPYLEGNFEAAAEALEAAGAGQVVQLTRALGLEDRGDLQGAARELARAGRPSEAAQLLLRADRAADAAELFEQAAEYRRAADCRRSLGDLAEAARLYTLDHAYDEAIACLRELDDKPALLEIFEMSGSCFEAAQVAEELGDADRAIANLQRVDPQLECYVQACLQLASLYLSRGEEDGALERFDEALRVGGPAEVPRSALRQHAELLERAGRLQDAVTSYERARGEVDDDDSTARIETLRKRIRSQGPVVAPIRSAAEAGAVPLSDAATAEAPTSRYEILEELGRGGMGVVYKARDTHLGRIVALKKLTDNLQQHPTAVAYFEREARSAAALNHPNIVTVYDAGQENGSYFISMEFLEGTPLDAIVAARGALPARTVARLGLHVATGLHYAHRNKIIHRDIKTANLFFTTDKIVKIMDFGLAKMVEEVRRASTIIAGTPYYMSPEQAAGDSPDHRADLYSLGVTMFQLLTGRVPFTDGDVTYHHRHTPVPDPREFAPDTPEPLVRLILQSLEKERENRIQTAAEIAGRLEQMLG